MTEISPLLIAISSSLLAFAGWRLLENQIFIGGTRSQIDSRNQRSARLYPKMEITELFSITIVFFVVFLISFTLTTSREISFSIAILSASLPFIVAKKRSNRLVRERERAWPEALDNIVSALQAGKSITEAITSLAETGPAQLKASFGRIAKSINNGVNLDSALISESEILKSSIADQTLSSLQLAKEFGGRDVTTTLRLLSNFLRESDAALEEIETKFSWVRNSAVLGAAAPWLLLALLSTQENTVEAYRTSGGKLVLSIGVVATAAAYLLMERISRIPESPRIRAKNLTDLHGSASLDEISPEGSGR